MPRCLSFLPASFSPQDGAGRGFLAVGEPILQRHRQLHQPQRRLPHLAGVSVPPLYPWDAPLPKKKRTLGDQRSRIKASKLVAFLFLFLFSLLSLQISIQANRSGLRHGHWYGPGHRGGAQPLHQGTWGRGRGPPPSPLPNETRIPVLSPAPGDFPRPQPQEVWCGCSPRQPPASSCPHC